MVTSSFVKPPTFTAALIAAAVSLFGCTKVPSMEGQIGETIEQSGTEQDLRNACVAFETHPELFMTGLMDTIAGPTKETFVLGDAAIEYENNAENRALLREAIPAGFALVC